MNRESQVKTLEEIKKLNFFNRLFRKLNTGSMRGVILMWIRMTLGIGILTLPSFVKIYGAFTGLMIIILSAMINYLTYAFIFDASYYSGQLNYPSLIKKLLGD